MTFLPVETQRLFYYSVEKPPNMYIYQLFNDQVYLYFDVCKYKTNCSFIFI